MNESSDSASMSSGANASTSSCTCLVIPLPQAKGCFNGSSARSINAAAGAPRFWNSSSNNITVARIRTHNLLRKIHINNLRKQQQENQVNGKEDVLVESKIATFDENETESASFLLLSELFCIVSKWLDSTSVGGVLLRFLKSVTHSAIVGKLGLILRNVEDLRKRIGLLLISTVIVVMKQLQRKKKVWIFAARQQSQVLLSYSGLLENRNEDYSYDADYDSEFEAEYDSGFVSDTGSLATASDSVSELEDGSDFGSVFESESEEENEIETTSEDSDIENENDTTDNDNTDEEALSLVYAEKAALALMNLKTFKVIKDCANVHMNLSNNNRMSVSEPGGFECNNAVGDFKHMRSESENFELCCTICLNNGKLDSMQGD
eukprot:CAMPEP_0204849172 /NCGR_PEP_ID=MMETSP1347-20130617/5726_1 /ASSEMBLY_ACC=CAM_ASM_000690 /TAXON_ID=215587 /ORGANISM="Aplanochytrium stocchinoi, Strain GSBS06" /LENGTH=377 /DNA_ID=CAMNT_0051991289 /DNA_START=331 /DNA_END=1465 /DNA_ORIENTATION=-